MLPISSVFYTQNDVVLAFDFIQNQGFGFPSGLSESSLLRGQVTTFGGMQHARSINYNHIWAESIFHADVDFTGIETAGGITFQTFVF